MKILPPGANCALGAALLMHSVTFAVAQSCDLLRGKTLEDGQLYYSINGRNSWPPFDNFATLNVRAGQEVSFIYVVGEESRERRVGVLVIKSGRFLLGPPPGMAEPEKNVQLVRQKNWPAVTDKCDPPEGGYEKGKPIAARAYDDYHDGVAQPSPEELKVLRRFHIKYGDSCTETDSTARAFGGASNREQFSFNPNYVREGIGLASRVGALLTRRAIAGGTSGVGEPRTEIHKYEVRRGRHACVRFAIPVSGPEHFLRVNDLEARAEEGTRRGPEHPWPREQPRR